MIFVSGINERVVKEPKVLSQYKNFRFDKYNHCFNEQEKVAKEITSSLNEKIISRKFKNWFRLISMKYVMDPLSCKGSTKNAIGGRFNIGSIKKDRLPTFPALYIGDKKKVCIKEVYGGVEQFYTNKNGEGIFSIEGNIHSVLDIGKKGSLDAFVKVIKKIKLSRSLQKMAKKLKLKGELIQNITQLKKAIYHVNWRRSPILYDIPSSSQIFGRLVRNAGIEAILYRSTKNSRSGLCLAVFPENFKNSESYIRLQDNSKGIKNKEINAETFENFY